MEVQKYFFSPNNINSLTRKLGDKLNLEDEDQYQACEELLKAQMKYIFKQNKENLGKASPERILKYLNGKAFETSEKIYYDKTGKNRRSDRSTGSSKGSSMDRDRDLYGDRRNRVEKRPRQTTSSRKQTHAGSRGMEDNSGNFGGYASFNSGSGAMGFIGADGTSGQRMAMNVNINDQLGIGDKRGTKSDLDRRMLERSAEYEGGGGGMAILDPMTGKPINMGMGQGDMGNGMFYDPNMGQGYGGGGGYGGYGDGNNFSMRKQRPPEIDFSLDGSGIRRNRDQFGNDISDMGPEGGNGMYGQDQSGSFDMNGMGNMSQMEQMMFMQQMQQQQQQNGYSDDGNVMARMTQQQNDRGMNMNMNNMFQQDNGGNNGNSNMNPMAMMQMFMTMMNGGGMVQPQEEDNDLDEMIRRNNKLGKSVANELRMSPQDIRNMDPDEIENMMNMLKKKRGKKSRQDDSDEEQTDDSDNDSEDESEDQAEKLKKKLKSGKKMTAAEKIAMIIELKKKNLNQGKKLNKYVKSSVKNLEKEDSEEDNSDEEEKPVTKKSTKLSKSSKTSKKRKDESEEESEEEPTPKKVIKSIKKSKETIKAPKKLSKKQKEESESDSDGEPLDESDDNEPVSTKPPPKKQSMHNTKEPVTETIEIVAKSADLTDNPSEYMITFGENDECLENVSEILISGIQLSLVPDLDDTCNRIVIDGNTLILDEGTHDISEIIEAINGSLESVECPITVSLLKGKIVIESEDNDKFDIDCSENSIGKFLGFTNETYENKSKYVAELPHSFLSGPIYLYIINISNSEPFAVINEDGSLEQKISSFEDMPISKLKCMIVHFRTKQTNDDGYLVNFGGVDNEITFSITTVK